MCSGAIDPSQAAMDVISSETKADYAKAGYVRGTNETPTPSILHLNGVISHIAISQMLRMLFGENFEGKEYLHYDRQNVNLMTAAVFQDDHCPVCGQQGYVGNGDEDVNALSCLSGLKEELAMAGRASDCRNDESFSSHSTKKHSNQQDVKGENRE